MEERKLAKIILRLRYQSISSAAKECGLNPSNVAGWLKGRPSTLSQEKQNIFLRSLGFSGGSFSPHIVHIWKILFDDLSNFQKLLSLVRSGENTIPEIVRLGPITPMGTPAPDFKYLAGLYAITGPFRALVWLSLSALYGSTWHIEDVFGENTSRPILKWRDNIGKDSEFHNEPTLRIDNALFNKLWIPISRKENVSLEDFDTIVHGNEKVTEEKKDLRSKFLSMTDGELIKEQPLYSTMLRDQPDWVLVERITGKKCPETVDLRSLARMTHIELRETLGLTDGETRKLSAALMLGKRLARERIKRVNQRLEKEKQDHPGDPDSGPSL